MQQAGLGFTNDQFYAKPWKQHVWLAVLTTHESVVVSLGMWEGDLSRAQMNALIAPLIKQTLQACRRALRDANLGKDEINDVVLVGGSTSRVSRA